MADWGSKDDLHWTVMHHNESVATARAVEILHDGTLHARHKDGTESYFAPGSWDVAFSDHSEDT